MDFFTKAKRLYMLDQLLRAEKTGNIAVLAAKLEISRAQMSHYINSLRRSGFPIAYSPERQTYYYTDDKILKINQLVEFRDEPQDQSHLASRFEQKKEQPTKDKLPANSSDKAEPHQPPE